jgi:hypothetical protein
LLRCQAQVCFDTGGTSAKFIGDLICRKLGSVGAIAAGGRTGSLRNSEHPLNAANDSANGTADRAPNWTGSTITFSGPFFCAPDNALSLRHQRQ